MTPPSSTRWWVGQLLACGRSIHEKTTLFWHNHFAMDALTSLTIPCELWYNQYLTLRSNALGSFPTLAKAITIDPAVLIFLNGNTNTMTAPNEALFLLLLFNHEKMAMPH